jgi:hypothetical protein
VSQLSVPHPTADAGSYASDGPSSSKRNNLNASWLVKTTIGPDPVISMYAFISDNVEVRVVLTEIPREHKAFIESRDCPFLFAFRCRGARSEHFCTDSWFQLGKGSAASKTPIRCRLSRRPS